MLKIAPSGDAQLYTPGKIIKTLGGAGFQDGRYPTGDKVQTVSARKG